MCKSSRDVNTFARVCRNFKCWNRETEASVFALMETFVVNSALMFCSVRASHHALTLLSRFFCLTRSMRSLYNIWANFVSSNSSFFSQYHKQCFKYLRKTEGLSLNQSDVRLFLSGFRFGGVFRWVPCYVPVVPDVRHVHRRQSHFVPGQNIRSGLHEHFCAAEKPPGGGNVQRGFP